MATITRFEDLDAWKIARELTTEIYRITSSGKFSRDFGLRDQIRKASVSIMSNVAEGFESLYSLARKSGRVIAGLAAYLRKAGYSGNKFKTSVSNSKPETRN